MRRIDALRAVYPELRERIVVTIMGAVAAELYSLGHRPNFFYLQHAMGLASSLGLGIALCRPELDVIVLDGDGSLLMNLGTLTTLARYRPGNLVHVVFDNRSLLSVGGFPTATAEGSDLSGIASAAGVPKSLRVDSENELSEALADALASTRLTTIVATVDATYDPPPDVRGFVTGLSLLENRYQFQRHLASLGAAGD